MATIEPTSSLGAGGRDEYEWDQINHDDDGGSVQVKGGEYTVTCEGTWTGDAQIDFQYGKTEANVANIDESKLRFTANGSQNIKIARGFVKPARSSGSAGADVNVYLTPIKG